MLRLFTTLYLEKNPARRAGYAECLRRNLACPGIDEIYLLVEGEGIEIPDSPKIRVRKIARRPMYGDYFEWINECASETDISVIANSDIYFDGSLAAVEGTLLNDECFALSRWDVQRKGSSQLFDRNDSQDVWIFRGPIRASLEADFPLGVPRCDNRILHELQRAGYQVKNPAFAIRAHHLHYEERTEYGEDGTNFVEPPYGYLWPHNLKSLPETLLHNLRHPDRRIGWRFDCRKASRFLPWRIIRKTGVLLGRAFKLLKVEG